MNTSAIVSALLAAADSLDGKPSVKEVLEELLARTGKTEDILSALADIYAEKAGAEEYADSVDQMNQTEELLRTASQAVADVWEA